MSVTAEQLLLGLRPRPTATFDAFVVTAANAATLHALHHWLAAPQAAVFFLSGPPGSGRSHLLQAACAAVDGALYLPLAELTAVDPESLLDGLETAALLVLDDIDAVVQERRWCEALFHSFNRHQAAGGKWLVSAASGPAQLDCALPDLASRLAWGGVFRLQPLDDEGRQRMLQAHARQRGMVLSDALADYILQRHNRDTPALLALLERIDDESLRTKQRVSINLVRKLLSSEGA